ncbi:hypothetical protein [uncultured Bacteroides sp.]|uniref:hypothetical protein n=1 Tax=uncultured Bacteroides sp. TaxID=162156 RepID=UPI00262489F8|nr:hypothetical protein [uncultured Bacteroides sp.]
MATRDKNGLLNKNYAEANFGSSIGGYIDFTRGQYHIFSTTCIIDIYVYSNSLVAFYEIVAGPNVLKIYERGDARVLKFKPLDSHRLSFKSSGTDTTIKLKVVLSRGTPATFINDGGVLYDSLVSPDMDVKQL